MLTSDVKRRIDSARDVLVGVAPNPTTQIEQITFALIYKFMHDMDQSAVKAGGEASFFTGTLKKYSWDKVLDSRLGNHEKMSLYAEALEKFTEAKQLPELFRSIFRSAYLPYKSPETLGLFLKEMNHFDYTHPEELGNAYEYLLSIMSSQGDAGQFRTPRHIIDFMVDVINPSKDDRILDPACGTGGFLISSYKHILEQHDGKNDPKKKEKPLTPDDRKKLMANLEGYDIDPTMVRIAQVNMYLHQFKNPQIFQYDTLTSDERWNDKYDVILANPPFMSPRGGIRPHNKFGVTSNRAEVLFVDYIVNHLKPKGRAGIIVPEGIIFQSGNAYKALRKALVENGLHAVVSLPGGVFQPYSGVKTSILLFDNELAKQKSDIAFVKISADGFDLGATKRVVTQNDLPAAIELLKTWANGNAVENAIISYVGKDEIASNGDYNLSGERYKVGIDHSNAKWPMDKLENITLNISNGYTYKNEKSSGGLPISRIQTISHGIINFDLVGYADLDTVDSKYLMQEGDILFSHINSIDHLGKVAIYTREMKPLIHGMNLLRIVANQDLVSPGYLFHNLRSGVFRTKVKAFAKQAVNQASINIADLNALEIPLPPLGVQEKIVAELDGYAAIISGAKKIIDNWKPRIEIDPRWEVFPLGDLIEILDSKRKPITRSDRIVGPYPYYGATGILDYVENFLFDERLVLLGEDGAKWESGQNSAFIVEGKYWVNNHAHVFRPDKEKLNDIFVVTLLNQMDLMPFITGVTVPKLNQERMRAIEIPLPSLEIQQKLAKEIEIERIQVESASSLIDVYEARTQAVIAKLWNSPEEVV
jgi:type I restriction enzyme M protein